MKYTLTKDGENMIYKRLIFLVVILTVSLAFFGCEGEQGPEGMTGSPGPQGATGSQGITGATGAAGQGLTPGDVIESGVQ